MPKVLLAFSWGHQFPKPGSSNEIIANELIKIRSSFDFVLAQIEISEAMKFRNANLPDFVAGEPGVYVNSFEVAKAMDDWLKSKQIDSSKNEVRVICHATHWSGLRMVLKKLKIQATRIPFIIPYDPNSSQWYTRGPLRAFVGKAFHFFGYLFRGELF